MRRLVIGALALLLTFAACGDGDDNDGAGSATVNGTIQGNQFVPAAVISGTTSPFVYVFTILQTTFTAMAITDFPDECGSTNVIGQTLYFSLFQDPTLSNSVVTEPGTFSVWLPDLNGGSVPTGNQVVVGYFNVAQDGSGSGQLAASGTVQITAVSSNRIAGNYDIMIGSDHVTGRFNAPTCEPWTRSGNIPAPQG